MSANARLYGPSNDAHAYLTGEEIGNERGIGQQQSDARQVERDKVVLAHACAVVAPVLAAIVQGGSCNSLECRSSQAPHAGRTAYVRTIGTDGSCHERPFAFTLPPLAVRPELVARLLSLTSVNTTQACTHTSSRQTARSCGHERVRA
jgi:hypothetical protein